MIVIKDMPQVEVPAPTPTYLKEISPPAFLLMFTPYIYMVINSVPSHAIIAVVSLL
jgi:hypothetical protein